MWQDPQRVGKCEKNKINVFFKRKYCTRQTAAWQLVLNERIADDVTTKREQKDRQHKMGLLHLMEREREEKIWRWTQPSELAVLPCSLTKVWIYFTALSTATVHPFTPPSGNTCRQSTNKKTEMAAGVCVLLLLCPLQQTLHSLRGGRWPRHSSAAGDEVRLYGWPSEKRAWNGT